MKVNLDTIPATDRRLLLVASEPTYALLVTRVDWGQVFTNILKAAGGVALGWLFLPLGMFALKPGLEALADILKFVAARRAGQDGDDLPLPHVDPAIAATRFHFDPGHPRDGTLYVANPCGEDHYLLPSCADERLAQEKLGVFLQVLAALGAKEVRLTSAEVESSKKNGTVGATLPDVAGRIGLSASFTHDGFVERQVYCTFDASNSAPTVPVGVARWLRAEPVLAALVETRLRGKARSARAVLTFGESEVVDTKLRAVVAGFGLDAGGDITALRRSSWSFEVEFWPTAQTTG